MLYLALFIKALHPLLIERLTLKIGVYGFYFGCQTGSVFCILFHKNGRHVYELKVSDFGVESTQRLWTQ